MPSKWHEFKEAKQETKTRQRRGLLAYPEVSSLP
jgi:hypothetical protein